MTSPKKKSVISLALQNLGYHKDSPQFCNASAALYARRKALKEAGKPITVANLTKTPIKFWNKTKVSRSRLTISSLTQLFEREAELASQLELTRKEITNVLGKGISEAKRRKISLEHLVQLCGFSTSRADEGSNEGG